MTRVILEMDYFYDINDMYNVKRITNICLYVLPSHENKILMVDIVSINYSYCGYCINYSYGGVV